MTATSTTETIATKADLAEVRQSIRASARDVEEQFLAELDRHDARYMAPPKRLEKEAMRWGGGYRSRQAADYDWFYGLSRDEQARLREKWFREGAQAPDEIAERMPIKEWLEHTRIIDASRAIGAGRVADMNAKRFGNLNVNSLIADQPYDLKRVWADDESARRYLAKAQGRRGSGRTWREKMWGSEPDNSRCQFFTDERGIVHPIRARCEGPRPAWEQPGYDPDKDEAF